MQKSRPSLDRFFTNRIGNLCEDVRSKGFVSDRFISCGGQRTRKYNLWPALLPMSKFVILHTISTFYGKVLMYSPAAPSSCSFKFFMKSIVRFTSI